MKKFLLALPIIILLSTLLTANDKAPALKVTAIKIDELITVDGILSESFWENVPAVDYFIQRDPHEGEQATERTIVKVVFDESAIYIGARNFDSAPDSIYARMARRDVDVSSDKFSVFLDPYHDKRSGYFFEVNAGGTLYDGVLFNDGWDDNSWDGVWDAQVNIDDSGWSAEMKIPFSQLKFHEAEENIWGINFKRTIARKNEVSYIVHIPKSESGFVSHFLDLEGIRNIVPSKGLEILPYLTTRAEYTHPDPDDPFNKGSKYIPGVGADLKMGIGSNLTLNATINPDFGQVEIDPAVINLSDVETFYSEKRPFFIEGSSIFNFGFGGANNYWGFNWGSPDFFYTRRVGRSPQGETPDADYTNYPEGTHILGAAKLTGKIGNSWNIGTIQALTSAEKAEMQINGLKSEVDVEPLTYYGIFRGQKEFDEGRQAIGFISTITTRNFSDDYLRSQINKGAFTGGVDGWTFLDSSKTWVFTGWLGLSHVYGTNERLISLQTNSQHYFQRPDSKVNRLDSSATSLTGYSGRFYLNKQKGNWFFNSAFGFLTPEFDVNDAGFFSRSDVINMHVGSGYMWNQPTDWYRHIELGAAVFRNYDFDGNRTSDGIFHFGFFRFTNYYSINWNLAYNPETISNRRTRGGPLTLTPYGYQANGYFQTDNRKDFVVGIGYFTYVNPNYSLQWQIDAEFEIKPASNISFSISPFFSRDNQFSQWVDVFDDPLATATFGKRYMFAELDQKTFGAGVRLNWTFTPNLSLQLYLQPLISSGEYKNFKELLRPKTYDFMNYGENGSTFNEEELIADPDGEGPAAPISISNPDFNFKSLRGNAVLRWEYMPGSVFYFVWTQTRSDTEEIGEFRFNRSVKRLWDAQPDNIFMMKFTYWVNM